MGPLSTGELLIVGAIIVLVGWAIIGFIRKLLKR